MFVNISHPSQMRDKQRESQIRSFNARNLIAKRKLLKKTQNSSLPVVELRVLDNDKPVSFVSQDLSLFSKKKIKDERIDVKNVACLDFNVSPTIPPVPILKLCVDSPFPSRTLRGLDICMSSSHPADDNAYFDFPDINKLGPQGGWPSTHCKTCQSDDTKHYMIQMLVTDPLLFEASMSLAMMYIDFPRVEWGQIIPLERPSTAILYHRGRSLHILLERLKKEPSRVDDATLMAIVAMIVLESTISDWPSYRAHIAGVQQLMTREGGSSGLKCRCFIRTQLTWAHLRLAAHEYSAATVTSRQELWVSEYPTHPHSLKVYHSITMLPTGIAAICLSGHLSITVIDLLDRTLKWTRQFNSDSKECSQQYQYYATGLQIITTLANILTQYSLSPQEEIFCIGLYAYINSMDGRISRPRQSRGLDGFLAWVETLSDEHSILSAALLWAALNIAMNNEPMSWSAKSRWHLLDLYLDQPDAFQDWEDVLKTVETFLWTPFLEEKARGCWNTALQRRHDRQTAARAHRDASISSYMSSTKTFEKP